MYKVHVLTNRCAKKQVRVVKTPIAFPLALASLETINMLQAFHYQIFPYHV
jgi:hypothetical protein